MSILLSPHQIKSLINQSKVSIKLEQIPLIKVKSQLLVKTHLIT